MDDPQPRPLSYASPQPPAVRRPMYALVLSVLACTFLIAFGALMGCAVLAMLYGRVVGGDTTVRWWWVLFFAPCAGVFLTAGVGAMRQTIAELRGTATRPPRWWCH